MADKEIRRGYVKWTDEDGVFHKEPLHEHPELLAKASPSEQLQAEEVRRLNEEGERRLAEYEADAEDETREALDALKAAPEEILTASQLESFEDTTTKDEPLAAPEEPAKEPVKRHEEPAKAE